VDSKEKVLSLRDMCSLQIARKGIDYKSKKLPLELQEYIASLATLIVVDTNVPKMIQITPRMVRAVILGMKGRKGRKEGESEKKRKRKMK
jgi:hypothetical protein